MLLNVVSWNISFPFLSLFRFVLFRFVFSSLLFRFFLSFPFLSFPSNLFVFLSFFFCFSYVLCVCVCVVTHSPTSRQMATIWSRVIPAAASSSGTGRPTACSTSCLATTECSSAASGIPSSRRASSHAAGTAPSSIGTEMRCDEMRWDGDWFIPNLIHLNVCVLVLMPPPFCFHFFLIDNNNKMQEEIEKLLCGCCIDCLSTHTQNDLQLSNLILCTFLFEGGGDVDGRFICNVASLHAFRFQKVILHEMKKALLTSISNTSTESIMMSKFRAKRPWEDEVGREGDDVAALTWDGPALVEATKCERLFRRDCAELMISWGLSSSSFSGILDESFSSSSRSSCRACWRPSASSLPLVPTSLSFPPPLQQMSSPSCARSCASFSISTAACGITAWFVAGTNRATSGAGTKLAWFAASARFKTALRRPGCICPSPWDMHTHLGPN